MSLVSSRVSLIHLCTIQRDTSTGDDTWASPRTPNWTASASNVACRGWTNSGSEPVNPNRSVALSERGLLLPPGTDVTENDRILNVTYRGTEILDGPMEIEAVMKRSDGTIELALNRVR